MYVTITKKIYKNGCLRDKSGNEKKKGIVMVNDMIQKVVPVIMSQNQKRVNMLKFQLER